MATPFIQLCPECFGFPVVELGLELVIKRAIVLRLQFQVVTELLEGLKSPLAGGSLHKLIKEGVCLIRGLILTLLHASTPSAHRTNGAVGWLLVHWTLSDKSNKNKEKKNGKQTQILSTNIFLGDITLF